MSSNSWLSLWGACEGHFSGTMRRGQKRECYHRDRSRWRWRRSRAEVMGVPGKVTVMHWCDFRACFLMEHWNTVPKTFPPQRILNNLKQPVMFTTYINFKIFNIWMTGSGTTDDATELLWYLGLIAKVGEGERALESLLSPFLVALEVVSAGRS